MLMVFLKITLIHFLLLVLAKLLILHFSQMSQQQQIFLVVLGTFFNLLQKENERIKGFDKEHPTNGKVLNNCVIYEYDFENGRNILKKICCCWDICEK